MYSILTVTTAATSYDLTTLANVKDELSVTDGASDSILRRYVTSASAAASQYCNRVFAAETISEQFLPMPNQRATRFVSGGVPSLQLGRWPLISVTSVTEDDVLLVVDTDYTINSTNGQLLRIGSDGLPIKWPPVEIVVVYVAGYATVPSDLEDAVIRLVTKRWSAKGRDATEKQISIPGVIEKQYWIATGNEAGNFSPDIVDVLDNYRTVVMA